MYFAHPIPWVMVKQGGKALTGKINRKLLNWYRARREMESKMVRCGGKSLQSQDCGEAEAERW